MGAVVSPWRSETISQKQEGAGRHSSPDEKTHVCGPLSSAQVFYIGSLVALFVFDVFCLNGFSPWSVGWLAPTLQEKKNTLKKALIYFQEWSKLWPFQWLTIFLKKVLLKDPIVPPTQDSLLLTQGCPCAKQREVLNMKKRKTASRIAHNLAPGQPHTQTPTNMRRTLPWLKEPIQREEFCQFLYRLYLKHWSS